MKTKALCLIALAFGLFGPLPCRGGIFLSTNGFEYFDGSAATQLSLTPALAADGGSSTVIAILPGGQVTNYYADPFPVNPPAGLSNVTAISFSDTGIILALTEEGTVSGWALFYSDPPLPPPAASQPPAGLSNVVAVSAGESGSLALLETGRVVGWGSVTVPPGLTNVVAIDARTSFNYLEANGEVAASSGGAVGGASNIIAISSDTQGIIGLRADGTVVGLGDGVSTNLLPAAVTNVVAISGGPSRFVALRQDGTIVSGGTSSPFVFSQTLSNVFYLGREVVGTIAAVTGDGLPAFTIQPRGQTVSPGQTVYLHARVVGQGPWQTQWELNGTDLPGATNQDLIVTNATAATAGNYEAVVSFDFDYTPYSAGSAMAQVTVLPPANAVSFTPPHFASDGSLVISANSSRGGVFAFTSPAALLLQASADLRIWTNVPTGWTITNGAISIAPSAQNPGSSLFYRLTY